MCVNPVSETQLHLAKVPCCAVVTIIPERWGVLIKSDGSRDCMAESQNLWDSYCSYLG